MRNQWTQAPESRSITCTPHQGLRVGLGELPVERQALEALIARLRQPDEGIFAVEGEPAHEARTEGEHLELGLVR